ncbi:unnamed protein product, partial [Rotaria socialis]
PISNQPNVRNNNNHQEQGDIWMSPSKYVISDVSAGLSFLTSVSKLFFQQEASLTQTLTGLSMAQRFRVINEEGQVVLNVAENKRNVAGRVCCAARRGFVLEVYDLSNQEVMRISREFKCCAGSCCWCANIDCCAYEVVVESPPGTVIGIVRQTQSCWRTHLSLMDSTGAEQLKVISPCCICKGVFCCCCENKFKIMSSRSDIEIGGIFKEYAGVVNQALTGAEKYTINFPIDMPTNLKVISLGALFLINFLEFGGNAETVARLSNIQLMGAKFGKSKSITISEKENEHKKPMDTAASNNIDGLKTLEKKNAKKAIKISKKKVNQCTSTNGGIISPSSRKQKLANGLSYNNASHDVYSTEADCANRSLASSKDIQEFREACIRRGIISSETIRYSSQTLNEPDNQVNTVQETSTAIVSNEEQVPIEQQV